MGTTTATDPAELNRQHCRKKFLRLYPKGFQDEKYYKKERQLKEEAYLSFQNSLEMVRYNQLLQQGKYKEIVGTVLRIEAETRLLSSQELVNIRHAVAPAESAKLFATGLFDYVYQNRSLEERFENYMQIWQELETVETPVLSWSVMTAFPFFASPGEHILLKPRIAQLAADKYSFPLYFNGKPNWKTYASLLGFANQVADDLQDLQPKDNIDLQAFMTVIGSDK
jgi:hypothetical protein